MSPTADITRRTYRDAYTTRARRENDLMLITINIPPRLTQSAPSRRPRADHPCESGYTYICIYVSFESTRVVIARADAFINHIYNASKEDAPRNETRVNGSNGGEFFRFRDGQVEDIGFNDARSRMIIASDRGESLAARQSLFTADRN